MTKKTSKNRYLQEQLLSDLKRKMVFVGGPRQVGKTTLAKNISSSFKRTTYLNWDYDEDKEIILRREWPAKSQLLILDEIHKNRQWRRLVKGFFDKHFPETQILVTGSARLDYYRYGGDSLQGRYHYLRLHPLTVAELGIRNKKELHSLLHLSGFPEPFLAASQQEKKRWQRDYRARIFRDDLRDLENLQELTKVELLHMRLPDLVGSPLSLNSLREDLEASHHSIKRWCEVMERLYVIFRLSPFGTAKIKAVKKEQKHYHFDWSLPPSKGAQFENLVACHLLKWSHYQQDCFGEEVELRYFRSELGHEVDFVLCQNQKPILLVECKWDDEPIAKPLIKLQEHFPETQAWQISAVGKKDYKSAEGIRVAPALELLKDLI